MRAYEHTGFHISLQWKTFLVACVCVCANWRCSVLSAQAHQQNIIIIFDITNNNVEYFAIYFRLLFVICARWQTPERMLIYTQNHTNVYFPKSVETRLLWCCKTDIQFLLTWLDGVENYFCNIIFSTKIAKHFQEFNIIQIYAHKLCIYASLSCIYIIRVHQRTHTHIAQNFLLLERIVLKGRWWWWWWVLSHYF